MSAAKPRPPETTAAIPPPTAPIAGVIFDFDGTLSELHIDFAEMRRQALAVIERHGVDVTNLPQTYTLELIASAARLLEESGRPQQAQALHQEALQAIEQVEMEAAQRARLFPWVQETLLSLRRQSIPCAVVTRNCAAAVQTILGRAAECLVAVLTREQVTNVKPHPAHLDAARRCLGCAPDQPVIMVGDHPSDMQAARAAGMLAVGVLSGSSTAQALAEAGAHFILADGGQLPALVRACNLRVAVATHPPAGRQSEARKAEVDGL